MAIVNVTGISGINSITAQSGSLNFYTAAGNNLPISAATLNVGTGASVSSPATNVLTLGTNNSERVRIGSTGSVGIGTNESYGDSNASFTSLSLGGNGTRYGLIELNKSDGIAGSWIDCYGTGGNGDLRITTAGTSGAITFWTGGEFTEKVRINSSGNVGINSTSPRSKLDVGGELILGRQDSSQEGGQISLCRSSDNASTWSIDAYGSTSTPSIRFVDNIAGASRMEIDGSGRVKMPYQPAFDAVYTSPNGAVGSTTQNTEIVFNVANTNVGSNYSTSTGRFTAPVAGTYFFSMFGMSNVSDTVWYEMRKNGNFITYTHNPYISFNAGGAFKMSGYSFIITLAVNDYVSVFTGGTTSGMYGGGNNHNGFCGYLIG